MKPLVYGALLGMLWLTIGLPLATPPAGVANLVQLPVLAFAAGILARPYLTRRGWSR